MSRTSLTQDFAICPACKKTVQATLEVDVLQQTQSTGHPGGVPEQITLSGTIGGMEVFHSCGQDEPHDDEPEPADPQEEEKLSPIYPHGVRINWTSKRDDEPKSAAPPDCSSCGHPWAKHAFDGTCIGCVYVGTVIHACTCLCYIYTGGEPDCADDSKPVMFR